MNGVLLGLHEAFIIIIITTSKSRIYRTDKEIYL